MKRRAISMLLAVAMVLSMFTSLLTASAAGTLDEAMASVDVFARNDDLNWLRMNGSTKTQHYTYYNYRSEQSGQMQEIPAYCVNPDLYGVPALVPEGTSIEYTCSSIVSDPKVCGIVGCGYPHMSLEALGLQSKEEAYYATKTALWCYLLSGKGWSINGLTVNPNADQAAAQRVLEATKNIYWYGMQWDEVLSPKLTATPDAEEAYKVEINGEQYYQQIFTVTSETWSVEEAAYVSLANPLSAPTGTKLVDLNNQEITQVALSTEGAPDGASMWGQFKVIYPVSFINQNSSFQINLNCTAVQYAIYYAECAVASEYGDIQDYMLDTDPRIPVEVSVLSKVTPDDPPPPPSDTPPVETPPVETPPVETPPPPSGGDLRIVKREEGTRTPLAGAVFEVIGPKGDKIGSFTTDSKGVIELPVSEDGNYTVTELTPPKHHLLPDLKTQHVTVKLGETAELTFWNAPYGSLRIEKVSDTGEQLSGVTIQIKHIESGETQTGQTGPGGVIVFDELKPGAYEVRELAGKEGWQLDPENVQNVTVVTGKTSTATFVNKELPGLRIIKYNRKDSMLMSGVTFEIWRDGESLGRFRTDAMGEILLTDLKPGTYRAFEVDTGNEGMILDTTPQEVELHAGDGIKELTFFNDVKPGMHLIKVDAADPAKVIEGAKFRIEAVNGSYGPKEFTTGKDGTIDLSMLPAGAYVVTELECPGYVIDDAQRIIDLKPNDNAEFVFTNSKLPDLLLKKTSADGKPLAGVTFRLAKVEDGTHYKDAVTNEKGEILWEGLEPGVWSLVETATLPDHILDKTEHHVELFPGKVSTITLKNNKRPNLIVYKRDADTGAPVPSTIFTVRAVDGHSVNDIKTDAEGKAVLENLLPGVYEITEKSVPSNYLKDAPSQQVTLYPNKDREIYFENHKKPTLTVNKIDSITGEPIQGAKFQVWYGSNNTTTGELNDLGTYFSDANGQFKLELLRDGWYKVTELEPAQGYTIKEPTTQEVYIKGGENKELVFENTPLSALIVWKYDSVTGEAVEGAVFQVKYLGGTSGTGGTVIGTYRTGHNGSFSVTGLKEGNYTVEELSSDGDHVIDTPPQTAYISGKEQDVVELYFGNSPKGALLVKKVDASNGKPISDVEFLVTDSAGTVTGDANGKFVTDSSGSFLVEGINPGMTLIVRETRAKEGYILDDAPQTIAIRAGKTAVLEFRNQPASSLLIIKKDAVNGKPISGVEFLVTDSDGGVLGSANGKFVTDSAGTIRVDGLTPGMTVIAKETRAKEGYLLDDAPQTAKIKANEVVTLEFLNQPAGSLVIVKRDSLTGKPLEGVTFKVTTSTGEFVPDENGRLSSNGLYWTDKEGKITINGVVGSLVVTETKTIPGYTIDPSTQTQTVVVRPNDTSTLQFYNTPSTRLVIEKYISGTEHEPLKGVTFLVTDSSGAVVGQSNGEFITDEDGRIVITDLEPGITVTARETKTVDGYVLDGAPKSILIKEGEVQTMRFYNQKKGTLVVKKLDKLTGQPLAGVEFKITYAEGGYVDADNGHLSSKGIYWTDTNGEIRLPVVGTVVVEELKSIPNYVIDQTNKTQTVTVNPADTQTIFFYNEPMCSLTLTKLDKVTGKPVPGTEFTVKDGNGNILGRYTTGKDGTVVVSGLTPNSTVVVTETKVPSGYVLNSTPQTIIVKNGNGNSWVSGGSSSGGSGSNNDLTFENEPTVSLTIHKYIKGTANEPLAGVAFKVVDGSGAAVGSSNGVFYTDAKGDIVIEGLEPGTVITAQEIKTVDGFVLDGTPQTVKMKSGKGAELTFWNQRDCTLTIQKFVDGTENEPLKGVEFLVTDSSGAVVGPNNGYFYTDKDGRIVISGLKPGMTITARETKALENFILDGTPQSIEIKAGEAQTLTFWNKKAGGLIITKLSGSDKKTPLAGVTFKITYADGSNVDQDGGRISSNGIYTTDKDGQIKIPGIVGTVIVTEVETIPGYLIDPNQKSQTVTINPNDTQSLTFYNDPTQTLVIQKLETGTKDKPLAGVEFLITDSSGTAIGPNNGVYKTDKYGRIILTGLTPGTVITARETKTLEGFVLDSTPQSIEIKKGEVQTLTYYNTPCGSLELIKVNAADKSERLADVTFEIRRMDGGLVDTVTTNERGRVYRDLDAGDYYLVEIETAEGFVIDKTPHYFTVEDGKTTTVTVTNKRTGGVEIIKVNEADKTQRIPGVTFEIRRMTDGGLVSTVTTGERGRVYRDLEAGDYYLVETETADGFKLDNTPHYFTVKDAETTTVTVENKPFSGILLHKINSITKKGIYNATFLLYDSTMTPVDQFTTDQDGYAYIDTLELSGKVYLRELKNDGYIVDQELKTVYVKPGETTKIEWENTPITGQIQITKKSADYNPTNGLPAGSLLEGAVFEIYDKAGNLVDTIRTDSRGVAVSSQLPLDRYTIREVKAPEFYGVSDAELTAYLEHAGQIVRFEVADKSLTTGVSITKTGPVEIMAGQPVRYLFSGIANNSNVRLDSFYWRDTLPVEVRLDTIVTGTYNLPGTYKITYRVNGGEPRTLADSLSTSRNYTLAASSVALGLAANERVTEIMFVFGQAPAGFAQVEQPALYCTALSNLASTSFVNVADVGGVHDGQWVQAVSRWVTTVFGKPVIPTLPRTGY